MKEPIAHILHWLLERQWGRVTQQEVNRFLKAGSRLVGESALLKMLERSR